MAKDPRRRPYRRTLWLLIARLTAAWVLAAIGQLAVDMPGGYLGAAGAWTPFSLAWGSVSALMTLWILWRLRQNPRGRPSAVLTVLLFSVHLGVFLPALTVDPVTASWLVVWLLAVLALQIFPEPPVARGTAPHSEEATSLARWLETRAPALRHLALVSLVLDVAVVGYEQTHSRAASYLLLALNLLPLPVLVSWSKRLLRRRRRSAIFPLLAFVSLLFLRAPGVALTLLALHQCLVLLLLLTSTDAFRELLSSFWRRPGLLILVTFLCMILVGALFLSFPAAAADHQPLRAIDALFTATSAVCVTGLIVVDTPTAFSPFGHGVLVVLIQVGGLGILVLSTFTMLLLGGRLGLSGEQALQDHLELGRPQAAYRLTRFIVGSTLAIEAAGALLLAWRFRATSLDWGEAIWKGVFHAVSAFCNAGFALQTDSLIGFQDDPWMLAIVAALITIGGLGFTVLASVRFWVRGSKGRPAPLQAKIVLRVSMILVTLGFVTILLGEWSGTLAGLDAGDRFWNALFQSVTLRTAGFNSVAIEDLRSPTILVMMILMFIGASPGSTGGGIKTTTLAVLWGALRATVHGEREVVFFGRGLEEGIVRRATGLTLVGASGIALGLWILLFFEKLDFQMLLFEAISAAGTVGLSLGATPHLSDVGRAVIIALMFVGRLGPLTMALLFARSHPSPLSYPKTTVMVG